MKIAYIILAHHLPDQVVRLVKRLYTAHTSFYIHYDRKSSEKEYECIREQLIGEKNVFFLPRIRTHWGDFSCVKATMIGINAILNGEGILPQYIVLLTGSCYPIKTNRFIFKYFNELNNKSVIENFRLPTEKWEKGGLPRFQNFWIIRNRRRLEIKMNRHMPAGLIPFGGSAYWCLSLESCLFVANYFKENREVINFFKHVKYPDEMFFQTILKNSHVREKIVNDDMRYIDWTRLPTPAILVKDDFQCLKESKDLFARKFDMRVDADILDLIDNEMLLTS